MAVSTAAALAPTLPTSATTRVLTALPAAAAGIALTTTALTTARIVLTTAARIAATGILPAAALLLLVRPRIVSHRALSFLVGTTRELRGKRKRSLIRCRSRFRKHGLPLLGIKELQRKRAPTRKPTRFCASPGVKIRPTFYQTCTSATRSVPVSLDTAS